MRIFILSLLSVSLMSLYAQDTLVLQPDAEAGKDARVLSQIPGMNNASLPEISAATWTAGGVLKITRSFIDFNVSILPPNAVITAATLTLSGYVANNHYNGNPFHGGNAMVVQRISEPWYEDSVTWGNMPLTDTFNQVFTPVISSGTNVVDLDITPLVVQQFQQPAQSYGFMLRMVNETNYYRAASFASSDHPDPSMHPKLSIVYQMPAGENPMNHSASFEVYPNPAEDYLFIRLKDKETDFTEILIFDIEGRKVRFKTETGYAGQTLSIHTKDFVPGIYLLQARQGNSIHTFRFIRKP